MSTDKHLLAQEELQKYYNIAINIQPRYLSKASVRRAYYRWIKDDRDTREWQDVFLERVRDHIKYYKDLADKKAFFKSRVIGSVELTESKNLIFKNVHHSDLVVSSPKANKMWVKKKVHQYCRENFCDIDFLKLKTTNKANITTKLCL